MRIAAFVPNMPGVSPGQRVRIETWAGYLEGLGWKVDLFAFEDQAAHDVVYGTGAPLAKARQLAACYRRQLRSIRAMPPCDVVFVYREAALVGPALLERLATRRAPLVYDLDDPTFLRYRSPTSGWASLMKFHGKTRTMLRRAHHVIAINNLIGDYATRFNSAVTVVPNFIDVERYAPGSETPEGPVRLIWIGSHSTAANLEALAPTLGRLQAERDIVVCSIGAGTPVLPGITVESRPWSAATEVGDLQTGHVGLVPLLETPWNHWKFFYKVLQYMAVGIPVVAQRMGSNDDVIEDGVNGFVVDNDDQWHDRLRLLVDDPGLRARMGSAARHTVVERFSAEVHLPRVASVFEAAAGAGR